MLCLNVSCQNSTAYLYVSGYFMWVSPCVGTNCVVANLFAPTYQLDGMLNYTKGCNGQENRWHKRGTVNKIYS